VSAANSETVIGVGLSGGADSSYAAFLLKQQGFRVRGFTMKMGTAGSEVADKGRKVAEILGIEHDVLLLDDIFEEKILAPFAQAYAEGRTPSPCVVCNAFLKFGIMCEGMRKAGCDGVATGHYVQYDSLNGLRRGLDPVKEQSYFLAQLKPEQLRDVHFPLGTLLKTEVNAQAKTLGLVQRETIESQDLCFLPDGNFAAFVEQRYPGLARPGIIVDASGKKLGCHQGAFRYTRGQRRGLGLGGGPWFVLAVNIADNLVVVGHAEETLATEVRLAGMNYLLPELNVAGQHLICQAQVRYRMKARNATLTVNSDDTATLVFDEPVSAVTPGQLAVCYIEDRVVASGWIC